MNYYDELLERIELLIDSGNVEEAKLLISNELSVPYVPRDVEERLRYYESLVKDIPDRNYSLSDEEIVSYLKDDEYHQLLAVSQLDSRNLRDHIDLCSSYLKGEGSINAKVLLIDSLIRQEIDKEFTVSKADETTTFNPSKLTVIEETEGYQRASELLEEAFMKEPSKLLMARQLLSKELLLLLPMNVDGKDGEYIADKIIRYINDAFESAN